MSWVHTPINMFMKYRNIKIKRPGLDKRDACLLCCLHQLSIFEMFSSALFFSGTSLSNISNKLRSLSYKCSPVICSPCILTWYLMQYEVLTTSHNGPHDEAYALRVSCILSYNTTTELTTLCYIYLFYLFIHYLLTYLFTYLLTYSVEQSPSWETNWFCS